MSGPSASHPGASEPGEEAQAGAHAAALLRTRIADGALPPGAKLSEHAVAAELGISRNTLRECFAMLAAEGLVLRIPHRGVFVARPTADDVRDLYAARSILESGAVLWGTVDAGLLTRLRSIVAAALTARDGADVAGMADANQRFHRCLVEAAGSPALLRDMDRALARMRLVFHAMLEDREFHARYAVRNAEVLAALESGHRSHAAELLRDSLGAARDEILTRLG
ncbi:GntR family transcriptional regulator [Kocuria rhizophila]|uniref:GntR family transcriptional regulator n=1 Tax=Kocuria rhizophila TaxID=72000 RepID=UPI00057E6400|nr:GntR family transcriptional regulator [Kocuria rhizophila]KIC66674.1 GntR family transcriptional regulator [Kocuria rhizophila]MBO4144855.1 GntR family transcriptional regulator [Kocuria rhizophila]MCR4526865.1 GntR family transcriptional regulator [Kocuria rhizophila]MCT1915942.1 GntR family transcriptional regulator [Kocuria rhizophila]MDA4829197.1 GntR family transcriptional regulator [Kocuria rhizophila]